MTPFTKYGSKLARLSYHIQFFVKGGNRRLDHRARRVCADCPVLFYGVQSGFGCSFLKLLEIYRSITSPVRMLLFLQGLLSATACVL